MIYSADVNSSSISLLLNKLSDKVSASKCSASSNSFSLRASSNSLAIVSGDFKGPLKPVPAGNNLPIITFSFRPFNSSIFPLIAASVKIFVVSWNDAADKNDSVSN